MKTKLIMAVCFIAACVTMMSCGGGKKQSQAAEEVAAMSIDEVMEKAIDLVEQTVVIEGVCTHTCSHGAKKMFLVGSDDTKTLRIEAGELGAFDTKVVNNVVTVKGTLKEERIDEAYLQDWEARLKAQTEEKHGNGEGEGGCDTKRTLVVKLPIHPKAVLLTSVPRLLPKRKQPARNTCHSIMSLLLHTKSMSKGATFRKWSRILHRDVSYLFAGMILIYALSGILMNHRGDLNPHYSVSLREYQVEVDLTDKAKVDKALVLTLLEPLGEAGNYTKHYFPKEGQLKVFLKGGSSLVVDTQTGTAVYESLKRRPLLSDMVKLHYNPSKWWTIFSDAFAVCLILITLTGMVMLKGPKGFWGRGGILFIIGIVIPVLFLVL